MELLIKLREKHGLTKAQMAKRLQIAKSYYSMLENDERLISKNIAIRLHKEFGIPFEASFLGPEVHNKTTESIRLTGTEGR